MSFTKKSNRQLLLEGGGGGGGGVTDPLNISQINVSNISVGNDATITRDLIVQRYLDIGRPRFMMLARTSDLALTGAGERTAIFNTNNSNAQIQGQFGVANGGEIQVSTGGWYRVSWSIAFVLVNSGNRVSYRTYTMTKTNADWTYEQLKDRIGSIGYCRSSSLNQETCSTGSVLRYIPASGWIKVNIGAMIQGSTNFSSSFNGTNLRSSSNLLVEFISSASEF